MYQEELFARRPNSGVPPTDKPALMRKIGDLPPPGPATVTDESTIQGRAEMLMAIDEGLGKMLAALEQNGQSANTIIVFTSDHGFWYGEHGLSNERRLAYEEAIRIPMLIRYPPAIHAGSVAEEMVVSIDLAPTLLEMAGVIPDKSLQGRLLVPVLNNEATDWRNSFLIEYYSDSVFERIFKMGYKAVRTQRYKYIHYVDLEGMDELYDLQQDPYELENIIHDPDAQPVLLEMKGLLNDHLVKTGAEPIAEL